MKFSDRIQKAEWRRFLDETIYENDGIYRCVPRYVFYASFVKEGLLPFIRNHGYSWNSTEKQMISEVASIAFHLSKKRPIVINSRQDEWPPEHNTRFHEIIDCDDWDEFWSKWSDCSDFEDMTPISELKMYLPLLSWNHLSLENSQVTQDVDAELEDKKLYDAMIRGDTMKVYKDDPYILDMLQGNVPYDKHF